MRSLTGSDLDHDAVQPTVFDACLQMAVLMALVMMLGCKSDQTKCAERLAEFAGAVDATIDSRELLTWAGAILQRYDHGAEPREKPPDSVATFEPNAPRISVLQLDKPKEKIVEIWWRTDYGRKGIMVGLPTSQLMAFPESCKREWKLGIVVFCQSE
jgi:hypothetical protein